MLKVLAFDLSSGESGIDAAVNAAVDFLNDNPDWKIKGFACDEEIKTTHANLEIIRAAGVIGAEAGILEVRRNPDTTLVKSIQSVIDGETDGVVSAAPSGPLVAAGYLMSKAIEGLKPAFTASLGGTDLLQRVILDVGANLDVDAETLNQYAVMGTEYAKAIGIAKNPNVHLLNIGTEAKKGLPLQKDAYALLSENKNINFKGNVESSGVFSQADVQVVVTDAYAGNIMLKSYEGAMFGIKGIIKDSMNASFMDKVGFMLTSKFRKTMKEASNGSAGGAIVLGLNHLVLKVHGAAKQEWMYNGLGQMKSLVEKDLIKTIKENV